MSDPFGMGGPGPVMEQPGEDSPTILAIDPGSKTGWALRRFGAVASSGTEDFKPKRFEGGGMRFLRFTRWLDDLHETVNVEEVWYEEVRRHAGVDAAHAYAGFTSHLMTWCERNNIPYGAVSVGAVKKHLTGKGNCNKEAMVAAVKALGFDPVDDNEADALAILKCVHEGIV